jgi:predicted DCC family thiol-disulfide oxidoreductase YuxK
VRAMTVLFDAKCGFCVRCRWWLAAQTKLVDLEFLAKDAPEVARRWPLLGELPVDDELVVISDEGGIYWSERAWLMCLWALEAYRGWSYQLAAPALLPFARRAFEIVSKNRSALSGVMRLSAAEAIDRELHQVTDSCPTCR